MVNHFKLIDILLVPVDCHDYLLELQHFYILLLSFFSLKVFTILQYRARIYCFHTKATYHCCECFDSRRIPKSASNTDEWDFCLISTLARLILLRMLPVHGLFGSAFSSNNADSSKLLLSLSYRGVTDLLAALSINGDLSAWLAVNLPNGFLHRHLNRKS